MTGAIMSMLTDTGYCHLGEGIFYVSGSIDMPANSTLCGCGDKTHIRLLHTVANGYCVKMKDFCTVKDVSFSGNYNALSPTSEGTRDAIWFVAGYESTPQTKTKHSVIENVKIRNFSGKGLYCYETSASPEDGLYVTNLFVSGCYAGVYVGRYSEFHKFTNICTAGSCYYGVINNGGNNAFTACTFRAAYVGFYIDGTLPNSGHGVINGCEFAHIGGNQGSAITLSGVSNGFIISNTLIGYGSITVNSSKGINFSNCWLGPGTTGAGATIRVSSGDLVMFNGCVFMSDSTLAPDIAVNNNTKVKFVNCYGADTGNAISA